VPAGLYAITPDTRDSALALAFAEAVLRGGASMIQYRNKCEPQFDARQRVARALADGARAAGAILIVNDDLELARAAGAHGVHLGRSDGDIAAARQAWPEGIIGATCHDRLDWAQEAVAAGADYVAFGAVYASSVKPDAPRATLALLTEARARLGVPVCAIGGITLARAGEVIRAGAELIAVLSDLHEAADAQERAAAFVRTIATNQPTQPHPLP
jgi:thiamine-phosphate pyrophosphorylase